MSTVEDRLEKLGWPLPELREPIGVYHGAVQAGNLLFVSGHGPIVEGKRVYVGKLGADFTTEQGQEAARITTVNALRTIKEHLGSLDAVKRIIKLLCFVHSAPGFHEQSRVMDGASSLLVDAFGSRGWHARSAVGMYELPFGLSVEIEMIVEIEGQ